MLRASRGLPAEDDSTSGNSARLPKVFQHEPRHRCLANHDCPFNAECSNCQQLSFSQVENLDQDALLDAGFLEDFDLDPPRRVINEDASIDEAVNKMLVE